MYSMPAIVARRELIQCLNIFEFDSEAFFVTSPHFQLEL
jgi:hypothetical protein